MNGRLIVIEGLDGSGKSTQAQILADNLKKLGKKVTLISYPDYEKPSSTLVRMYLNGDFSTNPDDINAYAASSFYAVDRYAGFMQYWGEKYKNGEIIIASRYVSSNAIHQMSKLKQQDWDSFLHWLYDYEYEKLKLPKPDKTIFLDMDRAVADKLILSRYNGDDSKKDIHEKNSDYLNACLESAKYAIKKDNWTVIKCDDGVNAKSIDDIAKEILQEVMEG